MRHKVSAAAAIALTALLIAADVAGASETITYTYDAKGRLAVTCDHVTANSRNGYTFDKADNRTRYESSAPDFTLTSGQSVSSSDGRFSLVMQNDGNLVLYQYGYYALWSSMTFGPGYRAVMQWDGNLVVYTASDAAVWNSQTGGVNCAALHVQNDGDVVITDTAGNVAWRTNTGGH